MTIRTFLTIAAIAAMGAPIMAQAEVNTQVACSEPANAGLDVCLGLPDSGVTNAVGFLGGIGAGAVAGTVALVAVVAVAASNSSNSTTSTTSTVSN